MYAALAHAGSFLSVIKFGPVSILKRLDRSCLHKSHSFPAPRHSFKLKVTQLNFLFLFFSLKVYFHVVLLNVFFVAVVKHQFSLCLSDNGF